MPCSDDYIQYVLEQIGPAGDISVRKMFGEYGLYMDGKVMGLICDNQVFLKKTEAGTDLLGEDAMEGYAYPGAKASFVFENLDDQDFVIEVLRATWEQLPYPKPKKNKK
ncbi:MAG: TfoX/Sxy family protein [Anaerolineaceae bacterium]|jgi:TfoX/Sxy family transcriptional regulator of competence genes|nr:TfoX/Sxy family protein [Anaerolineaceae bacterium]